MEANAQKYGVELVNFDNKQDPQQANTNVDNALTKKVDFYFQYNQDVEVNRRISQRLKDAGVKGIGIQVCMGDFPCYHVDNFVGGNLGGKAVAEAAKKKWTEEPILFVIGYPESGPLFQERARGAIAGAQAVFPNVKVFENTSKGDPERGRQITADFLTAHPTGKIIIWTHVDQMALAALSAIKAAGRTGDCLIASTGPDPSIFPELRNPDGIIVGTAGFFPEKWGDDLIPLAIKWLNGETTPPAEMNPFTQFINKENINQFYPQ